MKIYLLTILFFSVLISSSCSGELGGKGDGNAYVVNVDLSMDSQQKPPSQESRRAASSDTNIFLKSLLPLKKGVLIAIPEEEDVSEIYNTLSNGPQQEFSNILSKYPHAAGEIKDNKITSSLSLEAESRYHVIALGYISQSISMSNLPMPDRIAETEAFNPESVASSLFKPKLEKIDIIPESFYKPQLSISEDEVYEQFGKLNIGLKLISSVTDKPDSLRLYSYNTSDNSLSVLAENFSQTSDNQNIEFLTAIRDVADFRVDGTGKLLLEACKEGSCTVIDHDIERVYELLDSLTLYHKANDLHDNNDRSFYITEKLENLLELPAAGNMKFLITSEINCDVTDPVNSCPGISENLDSVFLSEKREKDYFRFSVSPSDNDYLVLIQFQSNIGGMVFTMKNTISNLFNISIDSSESYYLMGIHKIRTAFKIEQINSKTDSFNRIQIFQKDNPTNALYDSATQTTIPESGISQTLFINTKTESPSAPELVLKICSDSSCSSSYYQPQVYEFPIILESLSSTLDRSKGTETVEFGDIPSLFAKLPNSDEIINTVWYESEELESDFCDDSNIRKNIDSCLSGASAPFLVREDKAWGNRVKSGAHEYPLFFRQNNRYYLKKGNHNKGIFLISYFDSENLHAYNAFIKIDRGYESSDD